MKRTILPLAAVAASLAVAAPAAQADSIAFIRDYDVWLTTPDGSRQFQVTDRGNYTHVSQADDGTMIASYATDAERLQKLDRFGNVLADFATPVSDGPTPTNGNDYFAGPYDPEISPDGTKVAYSYYWQHYTYDPTACGGSGCMANRLESGTAITYSDRMTPWEEFGNLTGWQEPSWASNTEIVRFNAGVALSENAVVNEIGPGLGSTKLTRWLNEAYTDERRDGEVNRQQTKMVLIDEVSSGPGTFTVNEGIRVYDMPNRFAEAPRGCFRWSQDSTKTVYANPTWSPDGNTVAFEEDGNLLVLPVPDVSGDNCKTPEVGATKVLDNAREPDWGPADVPTSRPSTQPPGPGPIKNPGTDPQPAPGTPAAVIELAAGKAKLAKALKKGVRVTVTVPGAGALRAVGKVGSKTAAKGKATAKAAGRQTITLRFTKAGRKAVKGKRKATIKTTVTFTPAAGAPITDAVKISLKR